MSKKVIVETHHKTGLLSLNRAQAINALDIEMIETLHSTLQIWEHDPNIQVIIIKSNIEKGFCSGGDVKQVGLDLAKQNLRAPMDFLTAEYKLDEYIYNYPKPIIAFAHGITFGGGLGLIAGSSIKIFDPHTVLSMPEILIGFFPDVGASYFLNQLPHHIGHFMALTAARITAFDALEMQLTDFIIDKTQFSNLIDLLCSEQWPSNLNENKLKLYSLISNYAEQTQNSLEPVYSAQPHFDRISSLFQKISPIEHVFEKIIDLKTDSSSWLRESASHFTQGSPTSAYVIAEYMQRMSKQSLHTCFKMDLLLAYQFCQHPDFAEGLRARLIDKDLNPQWSPQELSKVSPDTIVQFFKNIA